MHPESGSESPQRETTRKLIQWLFDIFIPLDLLTLVSSPRLLTLPAGFVFTGRSRCFVLLQRNTKNRLFAIPPAPHTESFGPAEIGSGVVLDPALGRWACKTCACLPQGQPGSAQSGSGKHPPKEGLLFRQGNKGKKPRIEKRTDVWRRKSTQQCPRCGAKKQSLLHGFLAHDVQDLPHSQLAQSILSQAPSWLGTSLSRTSGAKHRKVDVRS